MRRDGVKHNISSGSTIRCAESPRHFSNFFANHEKKNTPQELRKFIKNDQENIYGKKPCYSRLQTRRSGSPYGRMPLHKSFGKIKGKLKEQAKYLNSNIFIYF
ncbi:hypothetical protein Catovirus_1_226 [Catovirus CTV1]|uniref:Uncharacterized protein n=1 Tax=Catovirus CTV1 TaxID=1977631 RepID=A0A1V0S900_9VIRU|nr:hypothetical protein Catovirus_1_226 [Catovirus CTV1]